MNILVLPNRIVLGNQNYVKKFTYERSLLYNFQNVQILIKYKLVIE